MGAFSNFFDKYFNVERDRIGNVNYFLKSDGFKNSEKYLDLSFNNPVLQTIITLRSKIFSQMRITHLDNQGNPKESSEIINLLKTPNFFQSQEDFLFQLMWFKSATGTNLTYQKKAFKNSLPKAIYNLIPSEINLNNTEKINKFLFDKSDIKNYSEQSIIYKLDDKSYYLQLLDIIPFYDLTNGLTSNCFMKSESRVKGISKTLQNINENIYSKNMNLQMSQKYLATSDGNMNGITPQMDGEDRNIIERILFRKSMHITKNKVDVKHLVSDFKKLFLDEMFSNDALTCLLAFEMNRDMLNYFSNGASTFENLSQGLLSFIQNSTQTDADSVMNSFSQQWGLFEIGEKLIASYDHLPVMQPVINEKIKTLTEFQNMIKIAIENGTINQNDANKKTKNLMLNLNL